MSRYIVKTITGNTPGSCCWGTYKRVAVLEVEDDVRDVEMISARARGVIAVVRTWDERNVGLTERCAYRRALTEARELAEAFNRRTGAGHE